VRKARRATRPKTSLTPDWRAVRADVAAAVGLGITFLLLYGLTAAPSVATIFDDSLEFQVVAYTLGIAHPTGYPLYTILGWLVTRLPWSESAQGVNLLSSFFGAITVAGVYGIGRQLSCGRLPAALGAAAVGLSPVLWSQATIAEVYTLHTTFLVAVLWLALWAGEAQTRWRTGVRRAYPLAVVVGLSLTHHRMAFLLLPPLLAYLWWAFGRRFRPRHWRNLAGLALLPLLLYAYLPLRGMFTSSLDGTYVNTPAGFLNHVTAAGYNVFLSGQAPGIPSRTPATYVGLFLDQFGPVGLALALLGVIVLARRRGPAILLGLALALNLAFALVYRVADYEVFFLPAFVLTGVMLSLGTQTLTGWAGRALGGLWPRLAGLRHVLPVAVVLVLLAPLPYRWPEQDRSDAWSVDRLGRAWLSSAEPGSAVIGILGETTLMRYFQVTQGLGPGVELVASDDERLRLDILAWLVDRGRPTYLTRPLPGAPQAFALDAAGELIRVSRPQPEAAEASGTEIAPGLYLAGWQSAVSEHHGRASLDVSLRLSAPTGLPEPLKLSVRASRGGRVVAAVDAEPVHNAYPTQLWRPGEVVEDYYRLEMPVGDTGGPMDLSLVVYSPQTGAQVGATFLGTAEVPSSPGRRPQAEWGLPATAAWLSDGTRLAAVSLGPRTQARAGEALPLALLWSPGPWAGDLSGLRLELEGRGGTVLELPLSPGSGAAPSSSMFRQDVVVTLPARLESGSYRLKLGADRPFLRWAWPPLVGELTLSTIEVQARTRLFEAPRPAVGVSATFQEPGPEEAAGQARLIGYDRDQGEGTLTITLYWQAIAEPQRSYKAFIHCLDAEGNIRAQSDQEPDGGRAPTNSWVRGEYIIDHHRLTLPPDADCTQLLVGLYDSQGTRLAVTSDSLVLGGNTLVLPEPRP
jgi:hypothetical protein